MSLTVVVDWVLRTESVPQLGERVLVFRKDGQIAIVRYSRMGFAPDTTHWTPLPAPPVERKEEAS